MDARIPSGRRLHQVVERYAVSPGQRQQLLQRRRANPLLVEIATPLPAGSALDLGSGRGGDAIWLAEQGWRVTAVDISTAAVEQLLEHARAAGLGPQIIAEQHELSQSFPSGEFDLISAQYFQSPYELPRSQILSTAAAALRPGGQLLIVDHGSIAPWSWNQDPDTHFPSPTEIAASLNLDPAHWTVRRADQPRRQATGPRRRRPQLERDHAPHPYRHHHHVTPATPTFFANN
ncbi:class I SAM-dependent methyltransferase [Kribbella sp. NPDC006257]|uniref:SAM-dependent methyltransferase n=1 Tax=Kribbella sp. NPDC006257 TaxID=3156738 RepID=UPI0033B70BD8